MPPITPLPNTFSLSITLFHGEHISLLFLMKEALKEISNHYKVLEYVRFNAKDVSFNKMRSTQKDASEASTFIMHGPILHAPALYAAQMDRLQHTIAKVILGLLNNEMLRRICFSTTPASFQLSARCNYRTFRNNLTPFIRKDKHGIAQIKPRHNLLLKAKT